MQYQEIIRRLKAMGDPKAIEGMARFGIRGQKVYGISMPALRSLAKEAGKDHALAQKLWGSGIHEARILASMVEDPKLVNENQMERWVRDFDSWDVCDQVCGNLFDKTSWAYQKAVEWSKRREEFVKRAGFALMACLAWHDKQAKDETFLKFFPAIKKGAGDERNFVKKAVNWALRNIGKRSRSLNQAAIKTAEEIQKLDSKSARWIATDALRELKSTAVQKRLPG
ncbi:MAG: DNA alkylation repair protein [Chloroflexi bacterium]|nr:DNA alkylation repair protein [Chloroflexota bacterium]